MNGIDGCMTETMERWLDKCTDRWLDGGMAGRKDG